MMGRLAPTLVLGIGCCAVVACNAISGADGLSAGSDEQDQDVVTPPASSSGGSSTSSSGATPPSTSSSSGGFGHGSSTSGAPPPPPVDGGGDSGPVPLDAGTTGTLVFSDDFGRADGALGNNWYTKLAKFGISGGLVLEAQNTASYKDLLVLRPTTEDELDSEISVDATIPSNGGDVSLYARVQPSSTTSGTLVGYTFYPGDVNVAYLDHETGSGNTSTQPVTSIALNPNIAGGQTIHMMLRVTGTSPVHIVASISDTSGKVLGSTSIDDTTPNPITTAGQVGFGSGGTGSKFDNFKVIKF
jgi:hypothetical protein